MQNGRAVRRMIESRTHPLSVCMVGDWQSIVFGNLTLICRQDIYSEAFSRTKVGMSLSFLVHANQYQRRIQRNRAERIGCHTVDLPFMVHGDHRDSSGETSHSPAKVCLRDHWWR